MLNVKQAAEQLRISVSLFYALIAAKKIRHERHGLGRGTIRIPPEAIEEYRQGRTIGVKGGESVPLAERVKPPRPRLKHVRVRS